MDEEINKLAESAESQSEKTEEPVVTAEVQACPVIDVVVDNVRYIGNVILTKFSDGKITADISSLLKPEDDHYIRYQGDNVATVSHILRATARVTAGEPFSDGIRQCCVTNYYGYEACMYRLHDGRYAFDDVTREFRNERYAVTEGERHWLRDGTGDTNERWRPFSFWQSLHYCEHCNCYVQYDEDWDSEYEGCIYCRDSDESWPPNNVIEGYCESHNHNDNPVLFGEYKDREHFAGFGFELEVDTTDPVSRKHNCDTAASLCSECGLASDEMRFAHDGSLTYGFECISEPHTIKDFWDKADKWRRMLSYLSEQGYSSHDVGTCGLHIHVSRNLLGSSKAQQDSVIAKIYTFFDDNWDNLCRVSRRDNFEYCDKNQMDSYARYSSSLKTKTAKWKDSNKRCKGSHYVALNNNNPHTFEFRLGRGTLNAWSFFSWIDLILTISKNARRITVNKVESNDILSWLSGIKSTTAKYIYKRGAWRKEMLSLYPEIEWESDLNDRA